MDTLVFRKGIITRLLIVMALAFGPVKASTAELPTLHLRKASTPPPVVSKLQDPATASAWYSASPIWFGLGGKTGDRNHTEVLATYDSTALYIAFMNIDRSTVIYPKGTTTALNVVDSNAVWIETPAGRTFYFLATVDNNYPPASRQASGEFPSFDPKTNKLTGWTNSGWYAGDKTIQQTIRIPWSTLGVSAPVSGAKWRVNFINYNQTSSSLTASTVKKQSWAPGTETQPDQWGCLAFDEAVFTSPNISPEAVLTLRPATGFGGEVTLRAGNAADLTNEWTDEAITQSNWNDYDPIDYTIKEYLQFDLSMVPKDRKIISATLQNNFRGHFESDPTDLYLHVVRLADSYDPATVNMLTSPLPVENGACRLVTTAEKGNWIDFDVTSAVSKAFQLGQSKVSFALAGSSGDIHNGKIWNVSFGRADYYDKYRPRLIITFGKNGTTYTAPAKVGSLNYISIAAKSDKNKLTNGTFRYGTVEGITNTTYWHADPGSIYVNSVNVPLMQMKGDINTKTGLPALRFMTPANWKWIQQYATGLTAGKTYTFSGWYKGSASGIKSDVRLDFQDASGNSLATGQAVYSGSGNWEQVKLTKTAPSGTVRCKVQLVNWTSSTDAYMLYSGLQLEEGSSATAYSETMGVYYPDYPRTDGSVVVTNDNCISSIKKLGLGSSVSLFDKVVTGAFQGFFNIQCPEAGHTACGIKVISTTVPSLGSIVNVEGVLSRDNNGELVIDAGTVTVVEDGATAYTAISGPYGVINKQVGGGAVGSAIGPDGGSGINLVGVLQTTWGRVSSLISGSSMTVDDGSGTPVKVIGPTGMATDGCCVKVTGVSSIEKTGTGYGRVLRTRLADDVSVLAVN
ncbi:MAG: DNRLRE domain-containing protein [Armatimonadota bacterium]